MKRRERSYTWWLRPAQPMAACITALSISCSREVGGQSSLPRSLTTADVGTSPDGYGAQRARVYTEY